MIYLVLSIIISSSLFVIFKLFDVFKVNTLQAIVVNYMVAFLFGFFLSEIPLELHQIPEEPWFVGAFFLGFLFMSVFNVMAITAQRNGLSVASIAGKMSVVIPVVFGIIVYKESAGVVKIIGISMALVAVYLSSAKSDSSPVKFKNLLFPLVLFFSSGLIDTTLKYVETNYVVAGELPMFLATIFGFAFVLGSFFLIIQMINGKFKFLFRNIVAGMALGVPNYYSMAFLLKALQTDGMESSTLFTINNVGVVIFTTVVALLVFKEKLIKKNWIGIALAIISIFLVVTNS